VEKKAGEIMSDRLKNWLLAWAILVDSIIIIISLGFIDWLVLTSLLTKKARERDLAKFYASIGNCILGFAGERRKDE